MYQMDPMSPKYREKKKKNKKERNKKRNKNNIEKILKQNGKEVTIVTCSKDTRISKLQSIHYVETRNGTASRPHIPFRTKVEGHVVLGTNGVRRQTTNPICTCADVPLVRVGDTSRPIAANTACITGCLRRLELRWGCKVQIRVGA